MRHFGKIILLSLAAALLLATAPIKEAFAQATPYGLPARGDQAQRATGKLIDFTGGNSTTTTYDVFDFGFTSELVRLCMRSAVPNVTAFFRMANAVTTSPTALSTGWIANRFTVPVSTSEAFIVGSTALPGGLGQRAMPLGTSYSTAGGPVTAPGSATGMEQNCVTMPLRGPGIVVHLSTGVATIEAWAVSR